MLLLIAISSYLTKSFIINNSQIFRFCHLNILNYFSISLLIKYLQTNYFSYKRRYYQPPNQEPTKIPSLLWVL